MYHKGRKTLLKVSEIMVPKKRLELLRLAALVPKTSVSTNSTTWAYTICLCFIQASHLKRNPTLNLKLIFRDMVYKQDAI